MRKLVAVALLSTLAGCEAPSPQQTVVASEAAATRTAPAASPLALTAAQEEGRVLYETVCWTCHGTAGRGDGPAITAGAMTPPPTFHTQDYATASGEELARRFRVGMDEADPDHPHMQYVASLLKPERFSAALAYVPALAYPPEVPGSALAGERIYGFRCAPCHGESGRGDGPAAAQLASAAPADFTADTLVAARDWDALYQRIRDGGQVHGTTMPAWGIVLDEGEMWDLVAFLGTFQEGALSAPVWREAAGGR